MLSGHTSEVVLKKKKKKYLKTETYTAVAKPVEKICIAKSHPKSSQPKAICLYSEE